MKRLSVIVIFSLLLSLLSGCGSQENSADIVATTLPVYQFTSLLCQGTDLQIRQLVTESVSCLHDYALSVEQVKAVEQASLVILSGAGLEDFMADILHAKPQVDASVGISLLESCHEHDEESHHHHHEADAHIWLSPANAMIMAENICNGLIRQYPQQEHLFRENLTVLLNRLQDLQNYGMQRLSQLSCRDMITFHDGFAYFAQSFDLHILSAVEEESGSEASAQELIRLIELVRHHQLPALFTETNGADSAAKIIAAETHIPIYTLNMAMAGNDYFAAMYHNIDTIKEAMG